MSGMSNIGRPARPALAQRADLTHRHNLLHGRHGWLRLTPAYSVKLVEDLVHRAPHGTRILDPFCGTGTTALSAATHGHAAATLDINPFLVWLAATKTAAYTPCAIATAERLARAALRRVKQACGEVAPCPPIHNISRWWGPRSVVFLCRLRAAVDAVTEAGGVPLPSSGAPRSDMGAARDLLLVAFCRTLIQLSNAAFNHQSMSFMACREAEIGDSIDRSSVFSAHVAHVVTGAARTPVGQVTVTLGDARALTGQFAQKFDLIITSPPYANRMSYIRELRPYMYWLGYLRDGKGAGELDWSAIGGTWGCATSRLATWRGDPDIMHGDLLNASLRQISRVSNKSAALMRNYVERYFEDIWRHVAGLPDVVRPGARVHYIVGNSTFYGHLVATEAVYAELLSAVGFVDVQCVPLRKRNSKKALIEFDVRGRWPGRN